MPDNADLSDRADQPRRAGQSTDTAPTEALSRTAISVAGHRRDLSVIQAALGHELPALRSLGLTSALRAGALDAGGLLPFLTDNDRSVRHRATELAARLDDPSSLIAALTDRLDDDTTVAEVAAFVLGEIGSRPDVDLAPTSVAALERQAVEHDDALCRESAVAALGALHTGLTTILRATGDKATVRRRAVIALAPFDGPEVTAALERALEDRDWQVRQAAEDLLAD